MSQADRIPKAGGDLPLIQYWAKQTLSPTGAKLWQTLNHQSACLSCAWGNVGQLEQVEIICGQIRKGAAMMFYPEVNAIFHPAIDARSGTPAFKYVPVVVYP